MSGVSDMRESIGFQALEPHRDGYRFLDATEGAGSRPSPIGDGSDAGPPCGSFFGKARRGAA